MRCQLGLLTLSLELFKVACRVNTELLGKSSAYKVHMSYKLNQSVVIEYFTTHVAAMTRRT